MSNLPDGFAPLGKHLIRVDGDSVFLVAIGPIVVEEMRGLLEITNEVMSKHPCFFVLYDGTKCTGMDSAARKLAAQKSITQRDADLQVAYGVPLGIRMMLNMIIRAQAVLINRSVKLVLFDGEAEALQFFQTEREKIRQRVQR